MKRLLKKNVAFVASVAELIWARRLPILLSAIVALSLVNILGPFNDLRFVDERDYVTIAQNLVQNGVYGFRTDQSTAYRPPGYVFFVAPFLAAGLTKQAINLAQILLWALNAYLAGRLAFRLSGPSAAGGALVLALSFPIFAYAALTLYPQTITSTLFLLFLCILLDRAPGRFSPMRAVCLGTVAGISILVTPPVGGVLAGVTILSWILRVLPLRAIAPILLTACLILAPWVARNWMIFGRPIVGTMVGANLLFGNSENTEPSLSNPDISRYSEAARGLTELEVDDYFRNAAVAWIRENPGRAAKLYIGKVLQFFNFRERYATKGVGGELASLAMFATYYPLLIFAFANFILLKWRPLSREEIILFLAYAGGAAAYAVFVVRLRYRIPFDYAIVVLAGVAISKMLDVVMSPPNLVLASDRTRRVV